MVAYLYRKIFIPSDVELMVVVKGQHVHVLKKSYCANTEL